jgi:hypothetical protein
VRARPDLTRVHQLQTFLDWLTGKASQAEVSVTKTGRSLRRATTWCWNVEPAITVTGEIYDQIQLDGIYLRSPVVLLDRHRRLPRDRVAVVRPGEEGRMGCPP